jgi:hypothetical protein
MNCREFESSLVDVDDGTRRATSDFEAHRMRCPRCAARWEAARAARQSMASQVMAPRPVPPTVTLRLLNLASKQHQAAMNRRTWAARSQTAQRSLWLWTENILRPLMVPATGGVASTVLLFALLTPLPTLPSVAAQGDIPIPKQETEAHLTYVPPVPYSADIEALVTVDAHGKMVSYQITGGGSALAGPQMRRQFETALLLMEFKPARVWGQAVQRTVRIVFSADAQVEIRG